MKRYSIDKTFLVKFFISIFYISVLFKAFSVVTHAYDQVPVVFRLYGDSYNSYTVMDNGGNTTEYLFPYYCICVVSSFSNGNYVTVICPEYILVDNGNVKGVDRRRVYRDSSGKITGGENATFWQMTGYTSSNSVEFENVMYIVRTMDIGNSIPIKGLCLSYNSNYVPDATWGIAASVLSGYRDGHLGATIDNANIQVDTSNIEQLITDSNTIASGTQTVVSDIKNEMISGSSSTVGIQEEDRQLLKRYDIWLVLIAFGVILGLMRTVIHQTGRNIRGR